MEEARPMTLGEIVDALRRMPKGAWLTTMLGGPRAAVSYRGYYDHLALVVASGPSTVEAVLATLDAVLSGETRTGYKGGTYRYDRNSPVWVVHDDGDRSDCGVTGIRRNEDTSDPVYIEMDIGWQRW